MRFEPVVGAVLVVASIAADASVVRGSVGITASETRALYNPANLINQSGLSAGYVSGATDFDTYTASTKHNSQNINNVWASDLTPVQLVFDLGATYSLSGLALWNRGADVGLQGVDAFDVYACTSSACAVQSLLGSYIAVQSGADSATPAQVFAFSNVSTAFVKLDIRSTYNSFNLAGLGEVVFREGAQTSVPEPSTLAVAGLALAALGLSRRR